MLRLHIRTSWCSILALRNSSYKPCSLNTIFNILASIQFICYIGAKIFLFPNSLQFTTVKKHETVVMWSTTKDHSFSFDYINTQSHVPTFNISCRFSKLSASMTVFFADRFLVDFYFHFGVLESDLKKSIKVRIA